LKPALHHFTHCKKLRHPHILTVRATLDTDDPNAGDEKAATSVTNTGVAATTGDLIIVTEPCITLDAWLQTRPPPEELAWGLEGIVRGLHFLHASANLSHCNICPNSLFVTKSGDVKLWNFSLVTPVAGGLNHIFLDYGRNITPRPYQSPERVELRWDAIQALNTTHNMDAFSLGVLISHLYGGQIPGPLEKAVARLLTTNLKMRPRLQPLLKCPLFDTPYQKFQLQLLEFAIEPVETKIGFWNNLMPSLQAQLIPEHMALYKILPLMKQSVQTICQSETIRTQELYRKEGMYELLHVHIAGL
jgi:SCY1-like protein 1